MNIYLRAFGTLSLCLNLSLPLSADPYAWKSKDGERSILAEFVSRDESNVTLKRTNGTVVTIEIDKLHSSTQAHLNKNHPHTVPGKEPEPVGNAFGPLNFGDDRNEVERKLLNSSLVTTKANKNLFGRTGLNGIFETAVPLGSLPCFLYFDWDDSNSLSEITIRTKEIAGADYEGLLRSTWSETIETLKKLYGNPLSGNPLPKQEELENGTMLASHLWRNNNGSILLGPGQEQNKYNVSIRFVDEIIKPVTVP